MSKKVANLAAAAAFCLSTHAALAQAQFPQGECSGILCSVIGGSQAPQNQPRKSLFPEGECGGILCSAIGGSQAPKPAGPPPACGGGLLCDAAPYAMGQPFITPEEATRRANAEAAPPSAGRPAKVPTARHRKSKTATRTPAPN